MVQRVVSRSQRRMEKKQSLWVLVLVFVVALVSFALGVMVGQNTEPQEMATKEPVRSEPIPVERQESSKDMVPEKAVEASAEEMTFYEALPQGDSVPLGTGINLPPQPQDPPKVQEPVEPPKPTKVKPPAAKDAPEQVPDQISELLSAVADGASPAPEAPKVEPPPEKKQKPAPKPSKPLVVQIASFRTASDATVLEKRLAAKGYKVFSRKVDLGEKGVWHRVMVGPFDSSEDAKEMVVRLKKEEKMSGLIKRFQPI